MFPDREFFMRSQGRVRFIKISSRFQKIAAAAIALVLLVWIISMSAMVWTEYSAASERNQLRERQAQVSADEIRHAKYTDDVNRRIENLAKGQKFLEAMAPLIPEDLQDNASDTAAPSEAAEPKISSLDSGMSELARLEARQIAFTDRLTRYAEQRASRTADALRELGLNPDAIMRDADTSAMGGPLELLATASDGTIDPRFEKLGASMARMSALKNGLDAVPQVAPAHVAMMTSNYGYRRDPFTGAAAMHSGLDFRGPRGAPIYAAAKGRVSFVGIKSGYGKVVEITHGNGVMTRYAHMSRFDITAGQRIDAGTVIGGIGSTGRSTGPHLHFEVRINGRAVNPRPFLEKAPHVLEKARSGDHASHGH